MVQIDCSYNWRDHHQRNHCAVGAAQWIRGDHPITARIRGLNIGQCQDRVGRIGNIVGIFLPLKGQRITAAHHDTQVLGFPGKIRSTNWLRRKKGSRERSLFRQYKVLHIAGHPAGRSLVAKTHGADGGAASAESGGRNINRPIGKIGKSPVGGRRWGGI